MKKVRSCFVKSFVIAKRAVVKGKRSIWTLEERTNTKGNDGDCKREREAFRSIRNNDHWEKETPVANWRSLEINQRYQTSTWLRNQNSKRKSVNRNQKE